MRPTHPSIVFAVVWIVLLGIDRARQQWPWSRRAVPRAAILSASQIALLAYGTIVVWYACQVTYFDPAEPTITAVASVFGAGKPLYPALDAPERYAHIYGPVLFIAHASAMALFGQSILVSKAVGVLAISASLFVAYRVFLEQAGRFAAVVATSACALVYLDFGNATFWTRPEPLVILCTVMGLYAACRSGWLGAVVVLGVAAGLSVNLKVSGPVYLLPAFALLGSRHGRSGLVCAAGLATLVGLGPYLLPNVSVTHYLQYIQLSARNGLLAPKFRQNIEWALFLSAPLAGGLYAANDRFAALRRGDAFLISLGLSLAVIAVIAAKPGAGPYHLLPSVTVLAYAVLRSPARVWERPWIRSLVAAAALTALGIAVPRQATLLKTVSDGHLELPVDDVRRFADAHPSSRMAVGYSGTSRFSDARTEIVFRTREYWLDVPAVQEHRLSGLPLPESTMRAMEECRVEYWLIPIGADAFLVPSAYWPDGPRYVFPDEFRQAFFRSYERTGQTRNFTVWECKARR
jgi:hypothetical protein